MDSDPASFLLSSQVQPLRLLPTVGVHQFSEAFAFWYLLFLPGMLSPDVRTSGSTSASGVELKHHQPRVVSQRAPLVNLLSPCLILLFVLLLPYLAPCRMSALGRLRTWQYAAPLMVP